MTAYFMDTSALIKHYITEQGSSWMTAQIARTSGNVIVIAELTLVEMYSVFARRQRSNHLSISDALQRRSDFLLDVDMEYLTVIIDSSVLVQARDLVTTHPLRTLDAIQLACALAGSALMMESLTFVSADTLLLSAAVSEGFAVDNPLLHP